MFCPKCNKEMIVVERNKVELDYCMSCEGFWFDYGEWNILAQKVLSRPLIGERNDDIYSLPKVIVKEEKRKCPICGAKMDKFLFYDDVILDRCPNRHGVWFDKGEFSKCTHHTKETNAALNFLGEVFYK